MARLEVNGTELPYEERGEGRPLLLIHGGGPDMHTLVEIAEDLAADHRVFTYNRRGFWEAGEVASSWAEHRDDAAALLEKLGVENAVVVSFSAGGIVAIDLALERPDLVSGLVLHEPVIYGKAHITPSLARTFVALQLRRRFLPPERAIVPFVRWVCRHRDGHSAWDRPDYPPERKQLSLRNARAVFADLDNGDGSHIPRERLRTLTCPVTLLVCERSQPWFHKIARTLQDLIPDVQRIDVPGVGHIMTFEDRPAAAEAIRTAVRAVPESGTQEPAG